MVTNEKEMEAEKPPFMERLKQFFHSDKDGEEASTYERQLLDSRIEKHLDRHADEYIDEFGLVTSIDLDVYEEKYGTMTTRISTLRDFANDTDADVSNMEMRLKAVKSAGKKRK